MRQVYEPPTSHIKFTPLSDKRIRIPYLVKDHASSHGVKSSTPQAGSLPNLLTLANDKLKWRLKCSTPLGFQKQADYCVAPCIGLRNSQVKSR